MNLGFAQIDYTAPIVTVHIPENTSMTYVDVKEMTQQIEALTRYNPYFLLVEMGRNVSFTREAMRSAGTEKEQPYRKATAVVFEQGFEKTVNELFGPEQPDTHIPRCHFVDKEEARRWLLQFAGSQ